MTSLAFHQGVFLSVSLSLFALLMTRENVEQNTLSLPECHGQPDFFFSTKREKVFFFSPVVNDLPHMLSHPSTRQGNGGILLFRPKRRQPLADLICGELEPIFSAECLVGEFFYSDKSKKQTSLFSTLPSRHSTRSRSIEGVHTLFWLQ